MSETRVCIQCCFVGWQRWQFPCLCSVCAVLTTNQQSIPYLLFPHSASWLLCSNNHFDIIKPQTEVSYQSVWILYRTSCVCAIKFSEQTELTQQREGHFHTKGSLIRSHRSKTAALSSHREFPLEENRELCSWQRRGEEEEEERAKVRQVKGEASGAGGEWRVTVLVGGTGGGCSVHGFAVDWSPFPTGTTWIISSRSKPAREAQSLFGVCCYWITSRKVCRCSRLMLNETRPPTHAWGARTGTHSPARSGRH